MPKKIKAPNKTIKYLEDAGIKHDILEHKTVYTAIDAAHTMKRKMEQVTKSLLIKADKDYFVVLLPADHNLDLDKLKKVVSKEQNKDVKVIKIPGEKIAREVLKVKNDAMAAFGSLYKVPVIVEKKLANVKKAIFSSESFNHSVEMAVKDFVKLEQAALGSFGVKKKIKPTPKAKKVVKKKSVKIKKKPIKKKK